MPFIDGRWCRSRPDLDFEFCSGFPIESMKGKCMLPRGIEMPGDLKTIASKLQIVDSSYGFLTRQEWNTCPHGHVGSFQYRCPFNGGNCSGYNTLSQRTSNEMSTIAATTSVYGKRGRCNCHEFRLDEPPYKFESLLLKKHENPQIACATVASFFATTLLLFPEALMVSAANIGYLRGDGDYVHHAGYHIGGPGLTEASVRSVCGNGDLDLENSEWFLAYKESQHELDRFHLRVEKRVDGGFYLDEGLMDWCVKERKIQCVRCGHNNKLPSGEPMVVGQGCLFMFGLGCGKHYICEECIYDHFATRGSGGSDYAHAVVENRQPVFCPECRCRLNEKGLSVTFTSSNDGGVVQRMRLPAPIPKLYMGKQGLHSDVFADAIVPFVERCCGMWYSLYMIVPKARRLIIQWRKTCQTELEQLKKIEDEKMYDADYCGEWCRERETNLDSDICSLSHDEGVLRGLGDILEETKQCVPFLHCNGFTFPHELLDLHGAYFEEKLSMHKVSCDHIACLHYPYLASWMRDELRAAGQTI